MEENSVKAIMIGVSIFIVLATFSAIILYYNSAKDVAKAASNRVDIASSFSFIENEKYYKSYFSGVEIRSIINKYAGREDIQINIVEVSGAKKEYNNINNTWLEEGTGIVLETKLNLINPVWTNLVEKVDNEGKIILNIKLNVNKEG